MKLAKIVDNKIVAIVDHPVADDRKDAAGNLIYRPVDEDSSPAPDGFVNGEREYLIKNDSVLIKRKLVKLSKDQVEAKKTHSLLTDPEFPGIHDRLDALEAGDTEKIQAHKVKIEDLKKKHKIK